jgi:hypothetical protein
MLADASETTPVKIMVCIKAFAFSQKIWHFKKQSQAYFYT